MSALERSKMLKDLTEQTEEHQGPVLFPELFTVKILRRHREPEDVLMMGRVARL